MRTHSLETAERGSCQDTERNRPSDAHSPTEDGRGRDLSEHGKKQTERRALTSWRRQKEGFVRTQMETNPATCTHFLETAKGGTCQDTERNRLNDAHSHPGDGRGRDLSGQRETDRATRTHFLETAKGLVRTRKEADRAMHTHFLETA